jgi:hypothetical protein
MTEPLIVPTDAPDWVQYEAARGVECLTCGREEVGVKAHDAGFDYCRNCYHTGVAAEDLRAAQLYGFRVAMPDWEVSVNHTGGGCFWLAFTPPETDGTFYAATDGEASLPEVDGEPIRDGWGIVCRYYMGEGEDDHADYEGTIIAEPTTIPGAMETRTYTNHEGTESSYESHSDRYWAEYPALCLTDAEIVAAILADWEKLGR